VSDSSISSARVTRALRASRSSRLAKELLEFRASVKGWDYSVRVRTGWSQCWWWKVLCNELATHVGCRRSRFHQQMSLELWASVTIDTDASECCCWFAVTSFVDKSPSVYSRSHTADRASFCGVVMKGRPTYDSNKRCSYQRRQFHWSATDNPISVHHMPQGAKNYVIMSDATYYVLSQRYGCSISLPAVRIPVAALVRPNDTL